MPCWTLEVPRPSSPTSLGMIQEFRERVWLTDLFLQEKLERVILGSKAAQQHPEDVRGLWQTCGDLMFSLEPRLRHLGLGKEVRFGEQGRVHRCRDHQGCHTTPLGFWEWEIDWVGCSECPAI